MANSPSIILLLFLSFSTTFTQSAIVNSLPGYPGTLPFNLDTGYITVGESEDMQIFYYFVESERNVNEDPLLFWITGGPGCSAITTLFLEFGPLIFNYTAYSPQSEIPPLQLNPYSWTKVASMLFLDTPVGTGFSYSNSSEDTDDFLLSSHTYEFFSKWIMDHPKFIGHPLYIGGDSYSGKIVPLIAQRIQDGNDDAKLTLKLNFKGYILGNPLTDVVDVVNSRIKYAHRVSLVSDELYETAKTSCKGDYFNIDGMQCAMSVRAISQEMMKSVNTPHILEPNCIDLSPKPNNQQTLHHFRPFTSLPSRKWCRHQNYVLSYKWANDERVQEALHVRKGKIDYWKRCSVLSYSQDGLPSSLGYHHNLTNYALRALIYSGDQDMVVPYVDTLNWITKLNISTEIAWRPWLVDGQVAGYATDYSNHHYNLTFTTIKGGGHTTPEYKPRECLAMIDRWLSMQYL